MARFVVRNLKAAVKRRLQERAARHGHSLAEEVRAILRDAVKDGTRPEGGLGSRIAALFGRVRLDAELPEWRGESPRPASFDG